MFLVQILLPHLDRKGRAISRDRFDAIFADLSARFGGVTAFVNSPARGLWHQPGETEEDSMLLIEVMTGQVDAAWWAEYRGMLEHDFDQDEVVIRSLAIERL